MESHGKPVSGAKEKVSPPAEEHEKYTSSYLAVGGSHAKKPAITKIPRQNGARWVLLLLLVAGGVAGYMRRDALLPWARKNSVTGPLVINIEKQIEVMRSSKGVQPTAGAPSDAPSAIGGDVTFSSGKGFGTVTSDDGSDSFRVVLPPEQEKK